MKMIHMHSLNARKLQHVSQNLLHMVASSFSMASSSEILFLSFPMFTDSFSSFTISWAFAPCTRSDSWVRDVDVVEDDEDSELSELETSRYGYGTSELRRLD